MVVVVFIVQGVSDTTRVRVHDEIIVVGIIVGVIIDDVADISVGETVHAGGVDGVEGGGGRDEGGRRHGGRG